MCFLSCSYNVKNRSICHCNILLKSAKLTGSISYLCQYNISWKKLYIKMNKIHNLKNCIMFYTIEHYSVMCIVPCVSPEMRMRKVYITNLKDSATGEKFLSQKGFSFSGQGFFQSVKYSLNYFHILQRFTSFQKEKILTAQDFRH